jgi:hypothetical protein
VRPVGASKRDFVYASTLPDIVRLGRDFYRLYWYVNGVSAEKQAPVAHLDRASAF